MAKMSQRYIFVLMYIVQPVFRGALIKVPANLSCIYHANIFSDTVSFIFQVRRFLDLTKDILTTSSL